MKSIEDARAAARERKRKQRLKEKEQSVTEVRLKLSSVERDRLAVMCKERAVGESPYDATEYLRLLIDRDWQKLQTQLRDLNSKCCGKCKDPLPSGCRGLFRGDSECFYTYPNYKELRL